MTQIVERSAMPAAALDKAPARASSTRTRAANKEAAIARRVNSI